MSIEIVLQTDHLKKHFGSVRAVEDISLQVRRGEIFGFLGPNGSGKTTTISMILGLTYPTSGLVKVFGQWVTPGHNRVLRRVGMMVGEPCLMLSFSARQNLQFMAQLYPDLPAHRIDEVLEIVGLQADARRIARKFSTGMKQRLELAIALLNKPDLLILDEPTNGLDPAGMHEVRTLLRTLADQGTTIFLSSHLLHEMELVCDRVAVLQKGRVVAQGTVTDLLSKQEVVRIHTADPTRTVEALHVLPGIQSVQADTSYIDVKGVPSEEIIAYLVNQGVTPTEVSIARPDLENVFLELTQKNA